ncbi:MAG: hypothetical protein ABI196_14005, partial [Bradyrhizobium sp.]
RPGAVFARLVALLATLAATGLATPWLTAYARSEATDMRILLSIVLLAPPAFCMGMMFPLGLSLWRRHSELLPFFWSANGITSMFASVLGMALSIEFGIARTYALGVCFYVVCALTIVVSRRAIRMDVSAARAVDEPGLQREDDAIRGTIAVAPSIQPEQIPAEWLHPSRRARERAPQDEV